MTKIRVPVTPFNKDGITHDTIDLELDYDKKVTGPVLRLQAVDTSGGTFRLSIFGSPRETITWDAGWRTNNAKKLAQAREAVQKDIENKSGRAWEAVKDFLKKHSLTLLNAAPVPVETAELVTV